MKIKTFIIIVLIFLLNSILYGQDFILLDDMDKDEGWTTEAHDKGSSSSLSLLPGKKGKAMALKFDLGNGDWAFMGKEINKDLIGLTKVRFYYKYDGSPNVLECKLFDQDGSLFGIKLPQKIDKTQDWKIMEINFSEFSYWWGGDNQLNLKNITRIEFALSRESGGKGTLAIDEVQYQTTIKASSPSLSLGVIRGTVVIDEFERLNPLSMYIPLKNDDSDLKLTSTREYVVEENYSMELEYELNTTKPYPSFVSAHWSGEELLDWRQVDTIKIWVKGDGSANYFRINIIDGSDEIWSYQDSKVLLYKNWTLVSIPLEKLRIASWSLKNNGIFDKEKIKGYEISIAGRNPETSAGKIYVDHFYAAGKDLIPALVIPKEVMIPITLIRPQGNFDIRGFALVEYKNVPAYGNIFGSYGQLFFSARLKNFGFNTELKIAYREFGESAAITEEGYLWEKKPDIESTSTRLYVNDLLPYLNHITIGNVWIDFSDYTFSPFHTISGEWGYKGIYGEGNVGRFSVQSFYLPHRFNSSTWGIRTDQTFMQIFTKAVFVQYVGRGKVLSDGVIVDGVIDKSKTGDLKTELIEEDNVFNVELDKIFFNTLRLRGLYGENRRIKYAEADISDPFNPYFNYRIFPPEKKWGHLIKGEIEIMDMFLKDLKIYFNIRDVDNNYKPKYRRKPQEFDELTSNQIGYKARVSQGYRSWVGAVEYDYIKRKTDTSKYRKWFMWGIDRYNWNGFDFFFHQEFKILDDAFERWLDSDIILKKEEVITYIFRVTYRFSSRANIIDEVRLENILHPETGNRYYTSKLFFKIEYFIYGNNKIFLEYQFLRTGDPTWRSITDDNYFKVVMEVNF